MPWRGSSGRSGASRLTRRGSVASRSTRSSSEACWPARTRISAEFEEATAHAEAGARLAEAEGHPVLLVAACVQLGEVRFLTGDLRGAIPCFERALGLSRQWEILDWGTDAATALGHAYVLTGRVAEGLPLLEAAVAEVTHTVMRGASSRIRRLGVGYLTAGRLAEALDCAQRALAVAREQGAGRHAAKALLFLGEALEALDPPSLADAHRCYDEALADAERRGFRPTAARAHLRLGLAGPPDGTPGGGRAASEDCRWNVPRDGHDPLGRRGGSSGKGFDPWTSRHCVRQSATCEPAASTGGGSSSSCSG